jgi:hypothetical protein
MLCVWAHWLPYAYICWVYAYLLGIYAYLLGIRVSVGYIRVSVGYIRVSVGYIRVSVGHVRVYIGHIRAYLTRWYKYAYITRMYITLAVATDATKTKMPGTRIPLYAKERIMMLHKKGKNFCEISRDLHMSECPVSRQSISKFIKWDHTPRARLSQLLITCYCFRPHVRRTTAIMHLLT